MKQKTKFKRNLSIISAIGLNLTGPYPSNPRSLAKKMLDYRALLSNRYENIDVYEEGIQMENGDKVSKKRGEQRGRRRRRIKETQRQFIDISREERERERERDSKSDEG